MGGRVDVVKKSSGIMYWDGKNVLKKRSGNGDEDLNDTLVGDSGNE